MEIIMTDFTALVSNLRRPSMLIRAARLGMEDYRRDRDLRRFVDKPLRSEETVAKLLRTEAEFEQTRCCGALDYSFIKHIEVLIALLSEVKLLPPKPKGA
jgi:Family of unknown function (DUF6477)